MNTEHGTSKGLVWYRTDEVDGFLDTLDSDIKQTCDPNDAEKLLAWPVVYVHVWRSKNGGIRVYVGEANDAVRRTREHWDKSIVRRDDDSLPTGRNDEVWQQDLPKAVEIPILFLFGGPKFHKSLTLDLENRLIHYVTSLERVDSVNRRANPQGEYAGNDQLDAVFSEIWKILHESRPDVFPSMHNVQRSAIYKASPNHKLTSDQLAARARILDAVQSAFSTCETGRLVLVEGGAGTGKTVLACNLFYEMLDSFRNDGQLINAYLVVNHAEQQKVYRDIARKMGLREDRVLSATEFVHGISRKNPVDMVFVDEAHLLWTQFYKGWNEKGSETPVQLDAIIARTRITIAMLDVAQSLRPQQYLEPSLLERWRTLASRTNSLIRLDNQLRMNCSRDTMQWVSGFLGGERIRPWPEDRKYEIVVFDDPAKLQKAIERKDARKEESSPSRLLATRDWPYVQNQRPEHGGYWEVKIDDKNWRLPLNGETLPDAKSKRSRASGRKLQSQNWAEQDHTIGEVGSTYAIQGFDLDFAGVILGPSIGLDPKTGGIEINPDKKQVAGKREGRRKAKDGSQVDRKVFARDELQVLLTRGRNGLYLYACDPALRAALLVADRKARTRPN